jgi:hypothetical protein
MRADPAWRLCGVSFTGHALFAAGMAKPQQARTSKVSLYPIDPSLQQSGKSGDVDGNELEQAKPHLVTRGRSKSHEENSWPVGSGTLLGYRWRHRKPAGHSRMPDLSL